MKFVKHYFSTVRVAGHINKAFLVLYGGTFCVVKNVVPLWDSC